MGESGMSQSKREEGKVLPRNLVTQWLFPLLRSAAGPLGDESTTERRTELLQEPLVPERFSSRRIPSARPASSQSRRYSPQVHTHPARPTSHAPSAAASPRPDT